LNKNLLIIAGETSGDLHGASLIRELKKLDMDISITGIGGNKMKTEGMELIYHLNQMSFLGLIEILRHIPFVKKVQAELIKEVKKRNIRTAVLIDYPGFNLSIAQKLKKLGIKIIYFISPQVWAWGAGRIKKIKRLIDKMLVILPFEEELFRKNKINVEFIGHPLLEQIENYKFLTREELFDKFNLDKKKEILLLLPGSRIQEVKKIFPDSICAADKLAKEFNLQVSVACSEDIDEKIFYGLTSLSDFKIIKGYTYDLYRQSKFGIIKSGTSTLEAGLFGLPMVIVYSTHPLTFYIGRKVVKIDRIGLVNIVAEEMIVPELLQQEANPEKIYETAKSILSDNLKYEMIKNKLSSLKNRLGSSGASKRAAETVYSYLVKAN
jgi:lipid-A-disaccharide synthase